MPWTDAGSISGVTIGTLSLGATFRSVDIELPITETLGTEVTSAVAEFRTPIDAASSRTSLPLVIARPPGASPVNSPGTQAAVYGRILLLEAGTQYEVRVSLNGGAAYKAGTVTTRAETITAIGSLVPTHYVDPVQGTDDTSHGTGTGTNAWKTLNYAIQRANAATAPMVIWLAGGYYARAATTLVGNGQPITIIAADQAVDDQRNYRPSANKAIIYEKMICPAGRTDAEAANVSGGVRTPWVQVDVTGAGAAENYAGGIVPGDVPEYTVWSIGIGQTSCSQFSYVSGTDDAAKASGDVLRVPKWKRVATSPGTDTLAKWAEIVSTNLAHNDGHWMDGTTQTLYVRMPGGIDPNGCWVWLGTGSVTAGNAGITLGGPNLRVAGLEFRGTMFGVRLTSAASSCVIDHCTTRCNFGGISINGTAPSTYGSDHVIETNRFQDSRLWSLTERVIPWRLIKQTFATADGDYLGTSGTVARIAEECETNAVKLIGGARRVVFRNNTVDGPFNGVGGTAGSFDRYTNYALEMHGNTFQNIADDVLETETNAINGACWDNTIRDVVDFCSVDMAFGPLYLFANSAWRCSNHGVTDDGHPTNPSRGSNGQFMKYGGPTTPAPRLFVVGNTLWNDQGSGHGISDAVGGSSAEVFYLRNNILRATGHPKQQGGGTSTMDEDYNVFGSSSPTAQLQTLLDGAVRNWTDPSTQVLNGKTYRQSGGGAQTNRVSATDYNFSTGGQALIDSLLTAPTSGDITLKSGANGLVASGVVVPNLMDTQTAGAAAPAKLYQYSGASPDRGYRQRDLIVAGSPPGAPTSPSATAFSSSKIDLAWTYAGTDLTGAEIERSLDGATGWSVVGSVVSTVRTFRDANLNDQTTYYYRIRNVNASGYSSYSSTVNATTPITSPTPLAPTGLVLTGLSPTAVRCQWVDHATNELGFEVERAPDAGGAAGTYALIGTTGAGITTYDDQTAFPGTKYWFRVRAFNSSGNSAYLTAASITTTALPARTAAGGRYAAAGRYAAGARYAR